MGGDKRQATVRTQRRIRIAMWGRTGIAENTGGRSTEYRDGMQQTPRTEDNDCDVGTYRQVRPTFPKRADLMTETTVSISKDTPKNAKEGEDVRIQATDAPGGTSLHLHRGKRLRAVNGMQE